MLSNVSPKNSQSLASSAKLGSQISFSQALTVRWSISKTPASCFCVIPAPRRKFLKFSANLIFFIIVKILFLIAVVCRVLFFTIKFYQKHWQNTWYTKNLIFFIIVKILFLIAVACRVLSFTIKFYQNIGKILDIPKI